MEVRWQWSRFSDLAREELYELLALRSRVFVVEQACVYLDADGKDASAWHLLGWRGSSLLACARVLPPGGRYAGEHSIGRVVSAPEARGQGLGHRLMSEVLERIVQEFGPMPVRISAQAYLEGFYSRYGFKTQGAAYLEDAIPHVEMLKT